MSAFSNGRAAPLQPDALHAGNAHTAEPFLSSPTSRQRTQVAAASETVARTSVRRAPSRHQGDPVRRRAGFFLKLILCRSKRRPTELLPTFNCFLVIRRTQTSSSVRSGSAATRSSSHCLCGSSGERQCPVPGSVSTLPVVVQRSIQRIAVDAPRLSSRAASRALSPDATSQRLAPANPSNNPSPSRPPPLPTKDPNLICAPEGIPLWPFRFTSPGKCSSKRGPSTSAIFILSPSSNSILTYVN